MSGRDAIGKRPLHRLVDFAVSELVSYQKGKFTCLRFRAKKRLIFQAESRRMRDTLFDHLVPRCRKNKGETAHSKFPARYAWSPTRRA
jgi:hypothetical protein